MIEDCTAIILAGGDSQRMGSDKARLLLDGQSLLQRVTVTMRQMFPKVLLSVRQPRPEIDLPQIRDDPSCAGPLAGLVSGLAAADTAWVFVVGCDMPFIVPEVIELLWQRRDDCQAVVPVVHGYTQPLAAFYAQTSLGVMRTILESDGKKSLQAVLKRLEVRYVEESQIQSVDPCLRSFLDLDTPQDVAAALHGVK
ncbi:MAG: molybdenum cofactor guanylyltransferase [Pseudomonadota bacterium]